MAAVASVREPRFERERNLALVAVLVTVGVEAPPCLAFLGGALCLTGVAVARR